MLTFRAHDMFVLMSLRPMVGSRRRAHVGVAVMQPRRMLEGGGGVKPVSMLPFRGGDALTPWDAATRTLLVAAFRLGVGVGTSQLISPLPCPLAKGDTNRRASQMSRPVPCVTLDSTQT